ncbi:MAG: ECF transporter S component [Spirochaetaceae bacterium]|nr:ECF transporter S component [Spirochaetaceae bacterium]
MKQEKTTAIAVRGMKLSYQMIAAALAIVAAVALPQVFHFIGAISGSGTVPGSVFSPMHLPVILVGLLAGPLAGGLAGLFSPVVSHFISGMPGAMMVPLMMAELAGYGVVAGLLCNARLPCIVKVVIAQIGGRLMYAVAILVAVNVFGKTNFSVSSIIPSVIAGLPGLMLQWAFIPLIVYRVNGRK